MNFYQQLGLLTLVFLLTANLLVAQKQVTSMSLEDAISFAQAETATIKEARINLADAEQQIIERRAFGLPQLNANVNYQRYLEIPVQPLPQQFDIFGPIGRPLLGVADDVGRENFSDATNQSLDILNNFG